MMTKKEKEALMESLEQNVPAYNKHKIDWEQRRYEIAKDYYVMTCSQAKVHKGETVGDIFEGAAWVSVVAADELIKVLKR
jgi:hypothetical protein